jgi:hypothetical protein
VAKLARSRRYRVVNLSPLTLSHPCFYKADWKEGFKKKQVGVSDMTLLTTISNESINENLQKRWTNAEIYTYIGAVLISVNPFRGQVVLFHGREHLTNWSDPQILAYIRKKRCKSIEERIVSKSLLMSSVSRKRRTIT